MSSVKSSKSSKSSKSAKVVAVVAAVVEEPKTVTPVEAPVAAPVAVRLSENDKKTDLVNFVLNPATSKYVKRDSPMGKKLVKAEETGEEVAKMMTETQRLILVIQTLQDHLGLEDSAIKAALTAEDSVKAELPRSFPSIWGGKLKTARHADHPKQPSNPYIFFTKAVRAKVVAENLGVENTEIVSIMAKKWKNTTEDERVVYNDLAAADKLRYEEAMKIFETEHPEEARAKSSPSNGKPTKETAYHLFSDEIRSSIQTEFPDLDGKQVTKKIAEMWDTLKKTDKEKVAKYQAIADKSNEDFEERVTEYTASPGSSPKFTKIEQAKADDPEHYELNPKTNRHMIKEGWKKNPDGSFVSTKKIAKPVAKPGKPASKPVAKPASKPVAKPASKPVVEKVVDDDDDDDLLA